MKTIVYNIQYSAIHYKVSVTKSSIYHGITNNISIDSIKEICHLILSKTSVDNFFSYAVKLEIYILLLKIALLILWSSSEY